MVHWKSLLVLLLVATQAFAAETLYVAERAAAPIYSQPDEHGQVISLAYSGTPLAHLASRAGFTRIKTPDGKIGWIKTNRLVAGTAKLQAVTALREQQQAIAAQLARVRQELAATRGQHAGDLSSRSSGSQTPTALSAPRAGSDTLILFGFVLLLTLVIGFLAGMGWGDYLQRKRHGGFRV